MKKMGTGRATLKEIKQRDIYLTNFPFSDWEESKVRPAIVISNSRYNATQEDVIMAAITGQVRDVIYSIEITNFNLDYGHMDKKCRIRCDKIVNVSKNRVLRKIGRVDYETFEQVKTEIFAVLTE